MPPNRTANRQKLAEQEGKILLAISDLKKGRIKSIREAVRIYNVSYTTLRRRLAGIEYRAEKRANSHKMTQYEEESLQKWILDLDKRGLPPRPSLVQDIANLLVSQREDEHVSEKWVYRFVNRHPEVKLRFSLRYNYERAKCEDIKIIQEHFDRVQAAIQEYGILSEDIYNFDETGFAMGLCATAKVITGSDRYSRPYLLQPGSGSQALTENVRHVKIFPSTGQALSMTPKDNTLGKCIRDTIPRAVPTLPSKPRTYGNGTRSSLTSTETVLNVRRN
ncbi:hypothetical protein EYB25_009864 [Talaromyces marneffei]|nr:hypothetical protein EYB25_009864 [Talaromyces marneffei]